MANTQSAVEQYRKLLESANAVKESAVAELRAAIQKKIEELNSFGFFYSLVEGAEGNARRPATRKRAASDKVKHCDICNLDGHDARNHRNQEPKKKFTKAELEEKGLMPPATATA